MRFKLKGLFLFLYIIFGLYFLNYPFALIKIPESISSIEQWIIFIGGILIIIGAISYFKAGRYRY